MHPTQLIKVTYTLATKYTLALYPMLTSLHNAKSADAPQWHTSAPTPRLSQLVIVVVATRPLPRLLLLCPFGTPLHILP